MRTAARKSSHVQTYHPKKQHTIRHSKKAPTLSIQNIKAHPLISLGSIAVALSTVSGLISWYQMKKNNQAKYFFFIRKR